MKNVKNVILSIILTFISICYTYVVKNIYVGAIGPNNSEVGLSNLNESFINIVGSNMTIYKISELMGYLLLLLVGIYGLVGLIQLIKRKSLFKVDREIICLGVLYVLMIGVYIFFEKYIINYRPILIDGELEASYPSSHTILSICVGISALMVNKKYLKGKMLTLSNILISLLVLGVFVTRLISGVHYLTDIIGGFIISLTLLSYFKTILNFKKAKE